MTPVKKQQPSTQDKEDRQAVDAAVGKQVIQALGHPAGLPKVQVHRLWEDHYRVNILTGADATSTRIANSYFLVTDNAGNIVNSTPKITRIQETGSAKETR
jgi:hypothetical protein